MLAIVLGLLLTVVVALGIMLVVAVPSMRQGSRILTPEGERAVVRARQQATAKPKAAVGGTWHGLVGLNRLIARLGSRAGTRVGRTWAPASAALHDALDRLESREPGTSAPRGGSASVGRPRGVPPISGPIPEIKAMPESKAAPAARVIDLRDSDADTHENAGQPAGSARHAR